MAHIRPNLPPQSQAHVLIKHLPASSTEESVKLLMMWSAEVTDCRLLPLDQSDQQGLRSALVRFNNLAGAVDAQNKLNGRQNSPGDPRLSVAILSPAPPPTSAAEQGPSAISSASSSASSSAIGNRQPNPRYHGGFQGLEQLSPTSMAAFLNHDLPEPDMSTRYHQLFSPQSPIGNHLSAHTGSSGKTLINNDFTNDEEDLLKDVLAYTEAESPLPQPGQRRATAPFLNGAMAALSINTSKGSGSPGPSSFPPYLNTAPAPAGPLSPTQRTPASAGYPMSPGVVGGSGGSGGSGGGFQRPHFPPVNPADQNPPCNTLYVGNLPIDTSEEELKAMFSKQRGYKRLCFRTKANGPMCFVEFEDISFATKALHELYGTPLHNSVKGGIRLSFSKNPLGVRSGQSPGPPQGPMGGINGIMAGVANGFASANGPPPGLAAPPGLGAVRSNYSLGGGSPGPSGLNGNAPPYQAAPFANAHAGRGWNGGHKFSPVQYGNGGGVGMNGHGPVGNGINGRHFSDDDDSDDPALRSYPPRMMGK